MTEMVERVARAMRETPGWMPSGLSESEWKMLARRAIAAMREPTKAMVTEGYGYAGGDVHGGPCDPREVWHAMIDEALS